MESFDPTEQPNRANASEEMRSTLIKALHATIHRAAKQSPAGFALLFTIPLSPDEDLATTPQLRLAAGFPTPQKAQESAQAFSELVQSCIRSRTLQSVAEGSSIEGLNAQAALAFPVPFANRIHGVLVIGAALPLDETVSHQFSGFCNTLALLLNQFSLEEQNIELRAQIEETENASANQAFEKSPEELLELSERLFAQDVQVIETNAVMKKIEKLKSDFIEKMSRELHTPLNDIIESIIAVIANEGDALSDSAKSLLRNALDDGSTFQRTLENIVELWRIRQGDVTLGEQEIDIPELIDEAIFSVQESIGSKQVEIKIEIEEPFPRIKSDLAKLSQIAFQILDNAAKFTPSGSITVRARADGGLLILEVQDTGIGICPEDAQLVFEEFFQVDDTRSGKYQGSGLGLTLVREFVKLLEGNVSVSSEIGQGSRFQVEIPAAVTIPN